MAVVLLVFAWKGSSLTMAWPPADQPTITLAPPSAENLKWAERLRPLVAGMLPKDRVYLSNFYDGMRFINRRDEKRDNPIIVSTEAFAVFHAGSLQAAIDRESVGKYPGLGAAIDEVFMQALGPEVKPLDAAGRERLDAACSVLAWVFAVHGDG